MFYTRAARAVAVFFIIMSLWSCRPVLTFPPAAEDASRVEARTIDTAGEAGRVETPPDAKADDLARIDAWDSGPELPQDLGVGDETGLPDLDAEASDQPDEVGYVDLDAEYLESNGVPDIGPDETTPDEVCSPDCSGKQCGSDGCGGTCGDCVDEDPCTEDKCQWNGQCQYQPISGCCYTDGDCVDDDACTVDYCEPTGVASECFNIAIPGCCNYDSQCQAEDPCMVDKCEEHQCVHEPDPAKPDCCKQDGDCADGLVCTVAYCQLATNSCAISLAEIEGLQCCWTAVQCLSQDPFLIPVCLDNECEFVPSYGDCEAAAGCDDTNPCTVDDCVPGVGCSHTPIPGCCLSDFDCTLEPLADGNPCTEDLCVDHVCQHSSAECCTNADCDDCNICTIDVCINYQCKHVKEFAGCCNLDAQCDDDNDCTLDECNVDTNVCEYQVDLAKDGCCASASDCYDGDMCTLDQCVNYHCSNDCIGGGCVAEPTPFNPICDDDNPCTCDMCIYGCCRNLGFGEAPPSCDLPESCCTEDEQCDDNDVCTLDTCVPDGCEHEPVDGCCHLDVECDDGDPETADQCFLDQCYNGVPGCLVDEECDDADPCTSDHCVAGGCLLLPVEDENCCTTDAECDDGDYCTLDTCNVGALACDHGPDPAKPDCCNGVADCGDGDLCTEDLCVDHVCVYQ